MPEDLVAHVCTFNCNIMKRCCVLLKKDVFGSHSVQWLINKLAVFLTRK